MEKDLDKKLYNDYLNGNKEAFEILYNKYKNKIEYFIYNIVKDYQKAEDLAQETFIYVMQDIIKENCSFKYYIYLKAKYLALNYIKHENKRNEIAEKYLFNKDERTEKDIFEIISKEETKKELLESIEQLDDKYKNAIYLTNIEELSYKETSKILGETLQNTKKLVYRGKIKLRNILIKKGFDEMNKVAKVLIIMIIATSFIGGVVYALTNVKISGRPVIDWFKVNFSDEYENYREEVQGEIIQAPSKSSVELVSTVCDEGFVILEFDVKLSAEDKKFLKIGEPILTDEYINYANEYIKASDKYINDNKDLYEFAIDGKAEALKEDLKELPGKVIPDSIQFSYNFKSDINVSEPYVKRLTNRFAIIDGEYYYIQLSPQSVKQISEYEYKVYQMYFLTDKELGDKTKFTLTMKDWVITPEVRQPGDLDTYLKIDGEFNIDLSKEKAVQNSKNIEINCDEVVYDDKGLTQKIESIVVTPLQIIVKVRSTYENVGYNDLTNVTSEDHIGIRQYKVLSEDGEEINSYSLETKRIITYEDGKEEEWGAGQIEPTRFSFTNATLETMDYILIEKRNDNSKIKIVSQEGNGIKKVEYKDIGSFEIDLTKEQK